MTDPKPPFLLYALLDPRHGALRYVGKTTRPEEREWEHLGSWTGTITEKTRLGKWRRDLAWDGLAPKFQELERFDTLDELDYAEALRIDVLREDGYQLLNDLPGGPLGSRAVFVSSLEGYALYSGGQWKTQPLIRKKSSLVNVTIVEPVTEFDRDPEEEEFFERHGTRYLNLYVPSRVRPKPGPHPTIDLILGYLCDGEEEGVRYLTHWIARKVQHPGRRNMTAIVLQGAQGTGKDTLAGIVKLMIGEENCAQISQGSLDSAFNSSYVDKLLIVADEVVNRENIYDTASELKKLITDDPIMLKQKFVDERGVKNRSSIIFTSNDAVPIRIEGSEDRRYSVFSNQKAPSEDYKARVRACFDDEHEYKEEFVKTEVSGWMYDLLTLKVDNDMLRDPHKNAAREAIARASQDSVDALVEELNEKGLPALMDQQAYGDGADDPEKETQTTVEQMRRQQRTIKHINRDRQWAAEGTVRCDRLYEIYRKFCQDKGFGPMNNSKFGSRLRGAMPWVKRVRKQGDLVVGSSNSDPHERPWAYVGLPAKGKVATAETKGSLGTAAS